MHADLPNRLTIPIQDTILNTLSKNLTFFSVFYMYRKCHYNVGMILKTANMLENVCVVRKQLQVSINKICCYTKF